MITPKPLRKGDTVALLAPSGPCNPEKLTPSICVLEEMGLRVKVMGSCYASNEYLAGSDTLRAKDVNDAFDDDEISGIIALRGGYGAQRILPLLDYAMINRNPKILAGYSDITALHLAINQRCGFITFHAPMPATDLCNGRAENFTLQALKRFLFNPFTPRLHELHNPKDEPLMTITPGFAEGVLTGGNLSLLASSLGTPFEMNTKERIVFIEETQESPYRIDRMLLQLKMADKFRDCRGIWLGSFSPENGHTLHMAVKDLLETENKPILCGFACGHCNPTLTLPLGAYAIMDAARPYAAVYI